MKRLILMRHGEAEPLLAAKSDKARRLTASGLGASIRTGQEIRARGFSPDLILSSDAQRAMETLEGVMRGGAFVGIPSKTLGIFYLADPETLLFRCCEVDDHTNTLLLIGHNPGWSETASQLSNTHLILETAQAALLEHSGESWGDALNDSGSWRLKAIIP